MYTYIYIYHHPRLPHIHAIKKGKKTDGDLLVIFGGGFWDNGTSYRTTYINTNVSGAVIGRVQVLEVDEQELCNFGTFCSYMRLPDPPLRMPHPVSHAYLPRISLTSPCVRKQAELTSSDFHD